MAKGAVLFAFGWTPGGPWVYRRLTRRVMGTQATHVDKLHHVVPHYVEVWTRRCGLCMEGARVWFHEGGWTPYPFLVNYLLTGEAGVVTNTDAELSDRYLGRAIDFAIDFRVEGTQIPDKRLRRVDGLRALDSAKGAVEALGGRSVAVSDICEMPLASESMDVCHSGGALEHYKPAQLAAWLVEAHRILRPGGLMSHVFDHRDHLYHADKRWPFLAHYGMSELKHRVLRGHRLMYHNRLLPAEITDLFESAGFEKVLIRRVLLPGRQYAETDEAAVQCMRGIERSQLKGRLRSATEADLHTAAAHYVFRKR